MCLAVFVCGGCGLDLPGSYPTLMRGAANSAGPIARSFGRLQEKMIIMIIIMTHTVRPCYLLTTTTKPKQQTTEITSTEQTPRNPKTTKHRKPPPKYTPIILFLFLFEQAA